jgi:His-Xaa-Ser system radical SAM maturase HxsB
MTLRGPGFRSREAFAPKERYRLLPFRFGRFDGQRYIVTNDVGEYVLLSREELESFALRRLPLGTDLYFRLKSKHFLFDDDSECAIDLLSLKYATRAEQLAQFTSLHMFVVTLRCDHSCQYCQVSRQMEKRTEFDMTLQHAEVALDHTFRSPASHLKIEFQGGEPLLNFELIRAVVERAEELNRTHNKALQFVIASNLAALDDQVLEFAQRHQVYFSTSLDGPAALHNSNRPRPEQNSHALTLKGIERIREELGELRVSALMTTSRASLNRVEEIIDEYVRLDFHSVFLRSLSPYGFAMRRSLTRRYDVQTWFDFYRRGLDHVLTLNRRGYAMREEYTALLIQKIFSPDATNYIDLQTPAGIGIAGIVYNYDGSVYASDEGRMLAEMGDHSFRLGHLGIDSYEDMMTSEALLKPLEDSLLESSPQCSDCPFLPYCGADPVFHTATLGDAVGHKAFSEFCAKQMSLLRHIINLIESDPSARAIMLDWI